MRRRHATATGAAMRAAAGASGALAVVVWSLVALAAPAGGAADGTASEPAAGPWRWPVTPVRIVAGFVAPSHDYGPGHRGIDLAAEGEVRAPAGGTVAFAGTIADRPLVTIDHGGGLISTLEPVSSSHGPGDAVTAGEVIGTAATGGHAPPGAVHLGVRLDGDYIDPLLLLGALPRAVLLPCC